MHHKIVKVNQEPQALVYKYHALDYIPVVDDKKQLISKYII